MIGICHRKSVCIESIDTATLTPYLSGSRCAYRIWLAAIQSVRLAFLVTHNITQKAVVIHDVSSVRGLSESSAWARRKPSPLDHISRFFVGKHVRVYKNVHWARAVATLRSPRSPVPLLKKWPLKLLHSMSSRNITQKRAFTSSYTIRVCFWI